MLLAALLLAGTIQGASPESSTASGAWPAGSVRVLVNAGRIAGPDRYATSVNISRVAYPGWSGVTHVVIASGEDRALSDPLTAAGLAGVLGAPLLLVDSRGLPGSVRAAIAEMPPGLTAIVVGGASVVPEHVARQIEGIPSVVEVERVQGADRYGTARSIAGRMKTELELRGEALPPVALLANGADRSAFSDALALSAISASTRAPVLLLERSRVPAATSAALRDLGLDRRIVAGGDRVVSAQVLGTLGAERWAGVDRYATAVEVSRRAIASGWATGDEFGMAASLPDALSGGPLLGVRRGTLLLTDPATLPRGTAQALSGRPSTTRVALFGGSVGVSEAVLNELRGAPARPAIMGPVVAGYVGKRGRVSVRTGSNTTELKVYHGDRLVTTRSAASYATVDLGVIDLPDGTLRVVAGNPLGRATATEQRMRRLVYPAATSIVVDKSDFRLYWVRQDVLVEAFPVGIGRTNAETPVGTWRIDSKYHTPPTSVYGPRKMRMYRKVGSRYVYTAYNIHGTNQPWAIGTKVSAGCVRMHNADVLRLYPQVPLGTIVVTRE